MDKTIAISIQRKLEQSSQSNQNAYAIEKMDLLHNTMNNFHQWANGKPVIAAFLIVDHDNNAFYLLLIDWHRNNNYYLVLYPQNKASTAAEIHQAVEDLDGNITLLWQYNPLKRDGKNAERKAYFKQLFGSVSIHIPLPQTAAETNAFLDAVFTLVRNRLRADRIPERFNL
jgi:hypothetical protein